MLYDNAVVRIKAINRILFFIVVKINGELYQRVLAFSLLLPSAYGKNA